MIGINHIYQCAHHPHVLLLTFMSTYNYLPKEKESDISSAVSDSLQSMDSPWNSLDQNTSQRNFLTNVGLLGDPQARLTPCPTREGYHSYYSLTE